MSPKFGTSGLRGLVIDFTPELIRDYTHAFLASCPHGGAVHVGQDLRPSSPEIAGHVIDAVRSAGLVAIDCGVLPTPALALGAMGQGQAAIMVTGSHIPADRNGLKFYVPAGEISKEDETRIRSAHADGLRPEAPAQGALADGSGTLAAYVSRYTAAFGPQALAGLQIGVYQHSSAARDSLVEVITATGGTAVPLARSDTFIPVDTEAVDPETRTLLAGWIAEHGLDAVISTDGDADRPMLTDETGAVIPGDVLGALTAQFLGATQLVTPVSSNSMVGDMPDFDCVTRTRIGSPFVIAGMEEALSRDAGAKVVGYEANGGFLLGFAAQGPGGPLAPLMTRDAVLPILAPLAAAKAADRGLAALVATLPPRFTAADRLQDVDMAAAAAFLSSMTEDASARATFLAGMPPETGIDVTDGLRISFEGGAVVHFRPSGNAPEFRCYVEGDTAAAADKLLQHQIAKLAKMLVPGA